MNMLCDNRHSLLKLCVLAAGSDESMRGQVKHIEEGLKKVRGELKHHKKPDGPTDKFLARMEVCETASTW